MKKLLISIIAAVSLLAGSAGVYADSSSSVQIANDAKSVSYTYTAGSKTPTSKKISELFDKLSDITTKNRKTVQQLKLTSASADSSEVGFVLIMSDSSESSESKADSVIGVYNIEVTDSDGALISKVEPGAEDIEIDATGKYVKNISLGKLNEKSGIEEKTYNISISVADSESERNINLAKENTDWFIKAVPEKKEEAAAAPSASAEPSASPEASATPAAKAKSTKYVGEKKDIVPGKYILTGNGAVKVYDGKGEEKFDLMLTDGKTEKAEKAVESYTLELEDGDKVEIFDYINLKPYDKKATATASPRATAAPAAAKSNKTNPKTGDAAPIAAVSIMAITALGVFAYLEYSKRKKN